MILTSVDSIRVLHVDDDPDFSDLVSFSLEREGDALEVLTEHSAEAGLERLETRDVDCVVSDYDMPGTNGLEFLEAVRERRRRRLDRQLEQLEHLGGVIPHDLRTPLGTVRGRLELARETGDRAHLRAAETSLDRLDELIDDLADVMRRGTLVRDLETVGLEDCIRSVWGSLGSDGGTLDVEGDGVVRADPEALKRLLENLLKNALEHGGPDVTVSVGTLPDGLYVEDDSPGIAEDERDRVFDIGYTTKESGSGFGLSSVRQLVVAHGWKIAATEGSEGGARFEISDAEAVG